MSDYVDYAEDFDYWNAKQALGMLVDDLADFIVVACKTELEDLASKLYAYSEDGQIVIDLDTFNQILDKRVSELDYIKEEFFKKEIHALLKDVDNQIDDADRTIDSMKEAIEYLSGELSAKEDELSDKETEVEELQEALDQTQEERDEFMQLLDDCQGRL